MTSSHDLILTEATTDIEARLMAYLFQVPSDLLKFVKHVGMVIIWKQ